MPDDASPLHRRLHLDTTETRKAARKYRRDHQVEEEAADDPPLLERTSPKGSLVQTFRLNLPDATGRRAERCRRLGLPLDAPRHQIEARIRQLGRRERTRRADLHIGLWSMMDSAVWMLGVLAAAVLFFYYGC